MPKRSSRSTDPNRLAEALVDQLTGGAPHPMERGEREKNPAAGAARRVPRSRRRDELRHVRRFVCPSPAGGRCGRPGGSLGAARPGARPAARLLLHRPLHPGLRHPPHTRPADPPYESRDWHPELSAAGCHRVVLAEEIARELLAAGLPQVHVLELDPTFETSHVRRYGR